MRHSSLARSPAWLVMAATVVAFAAFAAGCGTTEMVNMWRDPRYDSPPIQSAFVLAVRKDAVRRRLWEDSFVHQLAKRGVSATPSYAVYPDDLPDTSVVRDYLDQKGYDALFLSMSEGAEAVPKPVVGYTTVDPVTVFQPMWGTYVTYYRDVYHPGYLETNTAVHIRTDVWRRTGQGEGKLVWSGTSQTVDPTSTTEFSHEVAELVTHELAKFRVVP